MNIAPLLFIALTTTSSVPTVQLAFDDCIASPELVRNLVAIEIGLDQIVGKRADYRVQVVCVDSFVLFRVDPPSGTAPRPVVRSDLDNEEGPRILALHLAEMIGQFRARPPAPTVVETTRSSVTLRTGAAPSFRLLEAPNRVAWGARGHLALAVPTTKYVDIAVFLDAGFERGEGPVDRGTVRASAVSAAAFTGGLFRLVEDMSVSTLVGLRGGWGWLSGVADDTSVASSGNGPWFGPAASVRWRYGDPFGVSVGFEAGWTIASVTGAIGESSPAGLTRAWLGADVALDWRFAPY
ncbi:MAG: hypothetical protein AAFN74_06810 [Myxococcota bacterium]